MATQTAGTPTAPPAEEKWIAVYEAKDGQEIKLNFDTVKRFLVSGKANLVTEQELMFFIAICKARGLNPFKKDCYLIKYSEGDPAAIVVSIDCYRSRARAQKDCEGWSSGIIIVKDDGEPIYRNGSFIREGETLLGGWFKGKPAHWSQEFEWTIPLKPYVKKTNQGAVTRFWSEDNQPYMICKVAESQGLRRLWPDEFQGLTIEEDRLPTDVTPEPPLKIPTAIASTLGIKETTDGPKHNEAPVSVSAENSGGAGQDAVGASTRPAEGEVHQGAANGSKETKAATADSKGEPDRKQAALTWIATLDKDNFPAAKELNPHIKGLSQDDQASVCAAFNAKKKELGVG